MRGTKGGFFDRLIERLKIFLKIRKQKKLKIKKEEENKKRISEKTKKEKEININVFLKQKQIKTEKNINKVINVKKVNRKNENKKDNKNKKNYEKKKLIKSNNQKTETIKKTKIVNIKDVVFKNQKNKQGKTINNIKNEINNATNNKTNIEQIITNKNYNNIQFNDEKIIKEIKKIISNDKSEIERIISELNKISSDIKMEKNLDKIKQIEERLKYIEERINKILYNYELLKNKLTPDILLKMENAKLITVVGNPKSLNEENLEQIIDDYETKLDYYEEIILASNLKEKAKEDTTNRKIVVIEHKKEFDEEKKELDSIVDEGKKVFEQYILEDKKLKELANKIDKIQINKTIIRYESTNRILNKTGNFIKAVLGLPLIASFNPALIAVGSYLIGTSIKNMRNNISENKKEKIIYELDTTYIEELKKNAYTMEELERMISNNITDIKYFKQDYISNFGNYHDYSEYVKNLNLIEEIEKKLIERKKLIEKQKEKIRNIANKQQKKLLYIKELNTKSDN